MQSINTLGGEVRVAHALWLAVLLCLLTACDGVVPGDPNTYPVAQGEVREVETNRPLEGVWVRLKWYRERRGLYAVYAEVAVKTDANGKFFHRSPIPDGDWWERDLQVYWPGHRDYFYKPEGHWCWLFKCKLMRYMPAFTEDGSPLTDEYVASHGYKPRLTPQFDEYWVQLIDRPSWFQEGEHPIFYMEPDTWAPDLRVRSFDSLSGRHHSTQERFGMKPFLRDVLIETTDLLCKESRMASYASLDVQNKLFLNWRAIDDGASAFNKDGPFRIIAGSPNFAFPSPGDHAKLLIPSNAVRVGCDWTISELEKRK